MFSMCKRFLLFFILFFLGVCSVKAGELENALKNNEQVFLYMYTPSCGYCKKFNPVYNKIVEKYKSQYKFVKVDASTLYGSNVFRNYGGRYVPYVVLLNSKVVKKDALQITPNCLLELACVDAVLSNIK